MERAASIQAIVKYNPFTVSAYNSLLRYRCRTVRAYVFVATTGRSGSESLSRIFEAVDGAVCHHEPYPIMLNDVPEGIRPEKYYLDRFKKIKKINIRRSAAGHRYYMETNHQFIKKFCSQAVNHFGSKIRIIHLVRQPQEVAASFYALGSIPGVTRKGQTYLLDPKDPDNLIQVDDLLYDDLDFQHDFNKCLWYWYEIETRTKQMKLKYPKVRWIRIETDDLNDFEKMARLIRSLEIEVDAGKLKSAVGIRCNSKATKKIQGLPDQQKIEMHQRLLERMEERYGSRFWC